MLPASASGVYFQPYVSVCDASFAAVSAATAYGGYAVSTVPFFPFGTECTVSTSSATSPPASSPSFSSSHAPCFPCIGSARAAHGVMPNKAVVPYKGPLESGSKKTEDGQTPCQFYLRTGTCAFGARCKYYHPPNQQPPQLNREGYPVRRGERNCPFYMKHGVCSFGATCKFNHPTLSKPRGQGAKGRSLLAPPHMASMVNADYAAWTATAIPAQGWYMPHMPPSPPHISAIYPPLCCYDTVPVINTAQGSNGYGVSPAGSFVSSEVSTRTRDDESQATEIWEKSSEDDRCWSC